MHTKSWCGSGHKRLFAFLDADDEWMPIHLDTIQRLIQNLPDAGMFTTEYKIQSATGKGAMGRL